MNTVRQMETNRTRQSGLRWPWLLGGCAALLAGFIWIKPMNADDQKTVKAAQPSPSGKTELATIGGGCFWCTEAVFEDMKGVLRVTSGYAGGKKENPTYEEVCAGRTGHAEVIQIEFDPAQVNFGELLDTFWKAHDPTTMNRQGADTGTQYRSIILYANDEQRLAAEESKKKAAAKFEVPIVTEIVPLEKFYAAEEYHQDYFRRNPNAPYCRVVIRPKLNKLK